MKDIKSLRDDLCVLFEDLKSGNIEAKNAKEINNAAGKIINSLKVELEYAALRNELPDIEFLNAGRMSK